MSENLDPLANVFSERMPKDINDFRNFLEEAIESTGANKNLPEIGNFLTEVEISKKEDHSLTTDIHIPKGEGPFPLLVYFHGGGWVIGDLETHDPICRWLSVRAQCAVIAVDYRMGPEQKFPAAVDDCLAATEWVMSTGNLANVDPKRVAVGGDSAGGNLAAVVAHERRNLNKAPLIYQLLIYPATDLTRAEESQSELAEGYRLTGILMDWFIDHYLGKAQDRRDPKASPLFYENFSNLPPALIITAGFDPLRDEGLRYKEKLIAAGVDAKYLCYDGMIHGFMSMGGWLDKGKEALDLAADCLVSAYAKD